MKLLQMHDPVSGRRAGLLRDGVVHDLTALDGRWTTTLAVLSAAAAAGQPVEEFLAPALQAPGPGLPYADLAADTGGGVRLRVPIDPPEVWAFGVTYRRSAEFRSSDTGDDIYDRVYKSARPEIFYKGGASRVVGPYEPVCIRSDSQITVSEPELAYVVGSDGTVLAYTLCNDVSAWDLEHENPLYLPQSKIFRGCCALGPVLVTADAIADPRRLHMTCRIFRDGAMLYEGTCSTSQLSRPLDELNAYLFRDNPIPFGTVVSTGTGIIVPKDTCHRAGDRVEISIPEIGTLVNPVRQL